MAEEENTLLHDKFVCQFAQIGGDMHDTEVDDAAGSKIHQIGDGDFVEDHLNIGILLGEARENIGQQGGAAPGGDANVKHGPLFVFQILQITDQLAIKIPLSLQIGMEDFSGRGEGER